MKNLLAYLMGGLMTLSLAPVGVAAYANTTLCYDYEESRYEACSHAHVNVNYGVSPVYTYSSYASRVYPYNTTTVANQTYNKPVTRYVCDYDYYYGNRCYYKTDYVQAYRQVPVSSYPYNYYNTGTYNYNNYYSNYNYTNSAYNYSSYAYPYAYSNYGSYYPYSYNYNTAYTYSY